MKKITCTACGSVDLLKEGDYFVCQYCGVKYKEEDVKKMLVEGTVKIDSSDKLSNLYQLARRAKDTNNIENAAKYYEMIQLEDPSSWEATFYSTYYKSMGCKIIEIESAADSFKNSLYVVLELIRENVKEKEKQVEACTEVTNHTIYIASMFYYNAKNFYDEIDFESKHRYVQDWINRAFSSFEILYHLGYSLEIIFSEREDLSFLSVEALKKAIELHTPVIILLNNKETSLTYIEKATNKIKEFDHSYEPQQTNNNTGGCYIATSVYGSYNCSSVWTLRRYRDICLKKTWYGKTFIYFYYFISPKLVKIFGNIKLIKEPAKIILDKIVKKLQDSGIKSTFYIDF